MNNPILWFPSQCTEPCPKQACSGVDNSSEDDWTSQKWWGEADRRYWHKNQEKRYVYSSTWCWPWSYLNQSVLFLAACSKASYIALLICKLGPLRTCFEASLPFPVGSREKQSRGGVVRSGNVGIVVGWLLWPEPVLAPHTVQESTGLEDWQ